jgi:A-kinase anchor protein 11
LIVLCDLKIFFPLFSSKETEDFQSTESFSSQQMNLSVGEDSTGSWSNLSFEDDHQDESSSFHHLSER